MDGKSDLATVLEYVRKAGYYEAYSDWLALDLEEREQELEVVEEELEELRAELDKAEEKVRYFENESEWFHRTFDAEDIPRLDPDGNTYPLFTRLVLFVDKVKRVVVPTGEPDKTCHELLDQWDVPRWIPGEGWLSLDTRLEKFMEGIKHGGGNNNG